MLHATEILGAETYDSLGNFVGRVKEMFIVPDEQPNRISRLLLGRGQYRPLVARYDQIESVAPGRVKLSHRRIRPRALSSERSLARRPKGPARPANYRHERPQSSPRQRCGSRRPAHQRQHRAARHAGGRWPSRRGAPPAAGNRSADGDSPHPSASFRRAPSAGNSST